MNPSFEVLNKILQGEHRAIKNYQAFIGELTDGPLRNHLTAILTDHKEHAARISYFIQTNGGQAEEGQGLAGVLEEWQIRLANLREAVPMDILAKLYDKEEKTLAQAKEYSQDYLNSAEKELLEPIFVNEDEHLKQLQNLKDGMFVNY